VWCTNIWIERWSQGLDANLYLFCSVTWEACVCHVVWAWEIQLITAVSFSPPKTNHSHTHTFSYDYTKRKSVPAHLKDKFIMWNRQIIEGGCNEHVWVHCCRSSQCPQMEAQCSESNGILLFDGTTKLLNEVQMPCSLCGIMFCSR